MKIESLIQRVGGTRVSIGEAEYHFKPDATGAHVEDVDDNDHIQTFLGIPEGYRIADGQIETQPEDKPADAPAGGDDVDLEALDKEALAGLFEQRLGVKPPSTLSKAKIIEALNGKG